MKDQATKERFIELRAGGKPVRLRVRRPDRLLKLYPDMKKYRLVSGGDTSPMVIDYRLRDRRVRA